MSLNQLLISDNQDAKWSNIYCNTLNTNDMVVDNLSVDNLTASGQIQSSTMLIGDPQTSNNTSISSSGAITTPLINAPITNTNRQYAGLLTCQTDTGTGIFGTPPTLSDVNTITWLNQYPYLPVNGMTLLGNPGSGYTGFGINQKGVYLFSLNMALDLSLPLLGTANLVFSISQNGNYSSLMTLNAGDFYKSASIMLDCDVNDEIEIKWQYYFGNSGAGFYTLTASNNQTFTCSMILSHV